jgi:LPS sulfotransferase NodH
MLSYLVCATPRSGSTLLCHELDQTGLAGRPQEYFEALRRSGVPRRPHEYFDPDRHPNIVERLAFREMLEGAPKPNPLWQPDTYDQYLEWALSEGTTPNGVFGAKLMWGYLGDFAELLRGIDGNAGRPARARLPGPALRADHAPRQGPPGGVAVEGRADAGLATRSGR